MKIEISNVKGFLDYLPRESLRREEIRKVIRKWFARYGFSPVETPIIEYDDLMTSKGEKDRNGEKGEDEVISDRFKLRDKGKRNLGLRYEFTFQLAKIFKLNPNIKLPFRRYQIGEVFRDEPVSKDRFRQFVQCDADIIGDKSIMAEMECISLFSDILKELKVQFDIQVNNKILLKSIIESVQISDTEEIMRELDKADKIDLDQLKANLRKYTTSNQVITLLRLLEKDFQFFVDNAFDGVDDIQKLIKEGKKYGVKIKFNPFLARGLSYYTGNIFEILPKGSKSSIAAGGRYDDTVGKYLSREIPAVGISFGLERLTELAKVEVPKIKAMIISIDQSNESIKLVKNLRNSGISCIIYQDKVGKALEYADSLEIEKVVFVGKDEIEKKKYKLRNMESGKEVYLSEEKLIEKLKI